MYHPTAAARPANESLARGLAHAIEAAGKPRHRIANECGMHRETLLRVARGERPIGLDEAAGVLAACGARPRASMILALAGQEDLACEWMHGEMGEFLEETSRSPARPSPADPWPPDRGSAAPMGQRHLTACGANARQAHR